MSTIAIPAAVATELRSALYHQLGSRAEEIATARREPTAEDEWRAPVDRFGRACALLDVIGWGACEPEPDLEVDNRHRPTLAAALGDDLEILRWLAGERGEHAEGQRERATARAQIIEAFAESAGLQLDADEPDGVPRRIIVVSDEFLPLLSESLLEAMRDTAEAVEQAGFDVDSYREPLARLDRLRALLDAMEWGEHADIDLHVHREALQDALSERLATERSMMAEGAKSAREGRESGEQQREQAQGYVRQIEAFARDAGLDVSEGGERDA
jgi:hypothetical protein